MAKQKGDASPVHVEPADPVQQARARARHRLIGATVLLLVGIVGFPLVFETEPRPIPVDIAIEIPKKDAVPPLAMPAPRVAGATSAPVAAQVPAEAASAAPVVAAPSPQPSSRRGEGVEPGVPPLPLAGEGRGEGARARAILEGRDAAASAVVAQRFVVQVGAFADAATARETRQKVEKLGLKTYTQVAETTSGNRIRVRVGPFATRDDADTALAKAKAAGLAAVVLAL